MAIITIVGKLLEQLASVRQAFSHGNANLERLNQSILAKAFRGELVPQDPTDEPASVLLERIRRERAAASDQGTVKRGRGRPKSATP